MINDTLKTHLHPYRKPLEYWLAKDRHKNKVKMFITDTLLSLFPIISLFIVVAIGVVQVRHQKSRVYLYLFISIALYYGFTVGLQNLLHFYTIPVVSLTWLAVTYFIYRKAIVNKF